MVCNLYWSYSVWLTVFVVCIFLLGFLLFVLVIGLCYLFIVGKMRVVVLRVVW